MTVSASIYGQLQPPKQRNVLADYMGVAQIQNAMQQGEIGRMEMDAKRRAIESDNALNAAYPGALSPDGKVDRNKLLSTVATSGYGSKIPGLQKTFAEQDKSQAEAQSKLLENTKKRIDLAGQAFGFVRSNPTPEAANQAIDFLTQNGVWEAAQAAQYRAQVAANPNAIPQLAEQAFRAALAAKDQLAKYETKSTGGQTVTLGTDPVSGSVKVVNTIKNTASPDAVMADQRARDFNKIQQDANEIKRGEKKEIADLTKNSQVASMDTMLGTLDRLKVHPGLSRSVGVVGAFPTVPGSQSANFQAELNTFQSQAFIPMVAQLKGMGALSDAEGKKLTAAVGALDPKMGEEAFRESVDRIINDMEAARERLAGKRRNGLTGGAQPGNPAGGKVVDFGSLK